MPRMKKFADLHFFLSKKLPFLAALGMGNCFFSRKKLSAANFSTLGKIFPPYRNIYSTPSISSVIIVSVYEKLVLLLVY